MRPKTSDNDFREEKIIKSIMLTGQCIKRFSVKSLLKRLQILFLKNICFKKYVMPRAKGWIMYGMDSKLKFEDQLKNFGTIEKVGEFIT